MQSAGAAVGEIFADGFESGDPSAWSQSVGFRDCDDGYVCTDDTFVTGGCVHTPVHNICDNTVFCDGAEVCNVGDPGADPLTGCVSGAPPTCDDGFTCTDDSCEAGADSCVNTPVHGICGNAVFCDGTELCNSGDPGADPLTGCVSGTPPTCDDGVACTDDSCDAGADSCINLPNHTLCACGQSCDPISGCGNWAEIVTCSSQVYDCGNTLDDDGDCAVDDQDDMCLGPCDDDEDSLHLALPGSPQPCMTDCFFDGDYGSASDDCFWSHVCDPLAVAPDYYPEGPGCEYQGPGTILVGTTMTCAEAYSFQSATCLDTCLPITPNGCDCFGCCEIPGTGEFFWLGSMDAGEPSCTVDALHDPTLCKPCTPVPSCYNPCDECEICVGKPTLPIPQCACQVCPPGAQLCGPPCGTQCPTGYYCNTGCCTPEPS